MESSYPEMHVLIGVIWDGTKVRYVLRSEKMSNYKNVWSLLSFKATRDDFRDVCDLGHVQTLVDQLAAERLVQTPIQVVRFLTSGHCRKPEHHLFLYLYELKASGELTLNPEFYTDIRSMSGPEFQAASAGAMCGLCTTIFSQYCVRYGLEAEPFAQAGDLVPEGELFSPT